MIRNASVMLGAAVLLAGLAAPMAAEAQADVTVVRHVHTSHHFQPRGEYRRYHGDDRRYHGDDRRYHGDDRRYHDDDGRYHRRYHHQQDKKHQAWHRKQEKKYYKQHHKQHYEQPYKWSHKGYHTVQAHGGRGHDHRYCTPRYH